MRYSVLLLAAAALAIVQAAPLTAGPEAETVEVHAESANTDAIISGRSRDRYDPCPIDRVPPCYFPPAGSKVRETSADGVDTEVNSARPMNVCITRGQVLYCKVGSKFPDVDLSRDCIGFGGAWYCPYKRGDGI